MLKAAIIAFSTYSKLPMPQVEWDEKNMRYAICFFPLVGAAAGALVLPQQVLASYRLPAGGTVQVGRVCAQSVELWPGQAGEATVSPGGLLRVPLAVWGRTAMQPGRSWLGLLPFRQTLFLVDRGLL